MVESFWAVKALSPNLKFDLSVLTDELKALSAGGDEAGTVERAVRAMRTSK